MGSANSTDETLEVVAQVLIRCFVMGMIVLLFWFVALKLGGDLAFRVHHALVPITSAQFLVVHYAGMLLVKAVTFILFFFPYLSIRLVLMKRNR